MSEAKETHAPVVLRIAARRVLAADGEAVDHWRAVLRLTKTQVAAARAVVPPDGAAITVDEPSVVVTAASETDVRLTCTAIAEAILARPSRTTLRRTWVMTARPVPEDDEDAVPNLNLFGSDSDDEW